MVSELHALTDTHTNMLRCLHTGQRQKQLREHVLGAGTGDRHVFDFLMSSLRGNHPSLHVCSQVKGKKVIKQTIYQTLCVCLSNLPFLLLLKYTETENGGKKYCLLSP